MNVDIGVAPGVLPSHQTLRGDQPKRCVSYLHNNRDPRPREEHEA